MSDTEKIDAILRIIARDDEFCAQFAVALGESESEFNQWINTVILEPNSH